MTIVSQENLVRLFEQHSEMNLGTHPHRVAIAKMIVEAVTPTKPKPTDNRGRMSEIAESFSVLRGKPGVRPWNPNKLDQWALDVASSSEAHAARFVLGVWNAYADFKSGRFDLHAALNTWDESQRRALAAFLLDPYWP